MGSVPALTACRQRPHCLRGLDIKVQRRRRGGGGKKAEERKVKDRKGGRTGEGEVIRGAEVWRQNVRRKTSRREC